MRKNENIIESFVLSLGNDIYSQIFAEELLKGLMNEESLFLSGEQEQTRNQTDNNPSEQSSS